jgi:hypothetical protein
MTLILTFSQREKELPLPEGEGWGEGQTCGHDLRDFAVHSCL